MCYEDGDVGDGGVADDDVDDEVGECGGGDDGDEDDDDGGAYGVVVDAWVFLVVLVTMLG